MQALQGVLSALGQVFTTYVPDIAQGIWVMFKDLFLVADGQGVVSGLNELGYVAVGFIGISIVAGIIATVLGIFRLRSRRGAVGKKMHYRKR